MTTYNAAAVADSIIAYGKGITLQQGRALRDNPIAIAEGAVTAPVVAAGWHPYNSTIYGTGTGVIYDYAVDGALAPIETPLFEDGYEYAIAMDGTTPNNAGYLNISFYRATSAAYSAVTSIIPLSSGQKYSMFIQIQFPMQSLSMHFVQGFYNEYTSVDGIGTPIAVNRTVIHSTDQKISRMKLSFTGYSTAFSAGKIRLYRRRME